MADIPVYESTAETVVVVTANGQTTFAFDFLILFPEQMTVLHGRGDVETVLTYPADFSVSGLGQPNGGTVTLNAATLADDVITMRRVTPIERTSDWQAEGDYKAALVNREQDTMFMIMQEISRDTGKAVGEVSLMDGRITLEQQLRIAADTALGQRVDNEAYLREAGDRSVASLIGQAGPIETQVYDTKTAAELSVIKPTIGTIRTGGFNAAGDGGGAVYRRAASEPNTTGKFQSADGAWWQIVYEGGDLPLIAFGAKEGDSEDNTAALQSAIAAVVDAKVANTNYTYRRQGPRIVLPGGIFRFTGDGALTPLSSIIGLEFIGAGKENTFLIYENDDAVAQNWAIDTGALRRTHFRDMHIRTIGPMACFVRHRNTSSLGGSDLHLENVETSGAYFRFLDISGSNMGSEITMTNVMGEVGAGSTFHYNGGNSQSVNITYTNCWLNGAGTIIDARGGGNIRFFGGYFIARNGGLFLNIQPSPINTIGAQNRDYSFFGTKWEIHDGGRLYNGFLANVSFFGCNLQTITNSADLALVDVTAQPQQVGSWIKFIGCDVGVLRMALKGGVVVQFDNCLSPSLASMLKSVEVHATGVHQSPKISITNPQGLGALEEEWFPGERDNGGASRVPIYTPGNTRLKTGMFRSGGGNGSGLPIGNRSFSIVLPLGCTIRRVHVVRTTAWSSVTGTRNITVKSYDDAVTFFENATFPGTGRVVESGPDMMMYLVDTEAKRTLTFHGNYGTSDNGLQDYGYVLVEYY